MTYNLFIGRYQSPHKGHQTIFNEYLEKGLPVLIAVRDVEPDDKNPLSAEDVKRLWEEIYRDNPLVKVIIIPDIASVNYGRGVGYSVNEIQVDAATANISATEIRRQILTGETEWKSLVNINAHQLLTELLKNKAKP